MSKIDILSSEKTETPKTGMEKIKGCFSNTLGAVLIATPILAISALDNNAHGAEKTIKSPAVATKSLKTEEKLPQIALENEQIYEFLEGDITEKDTSKSLYMKLRRKLYSMTSDSMYDEFIFAIHCEMLYREKTNKPESILLNKAMKQMKNEQEAAKKLNTFLLRLSIEDIGKMNGAIIAYYNAIGGDNWGEQELEKWKKELEKERTKLHYTYQDAMVWVIQYEKQRKKGEKKSIRM